MTPDIRAGLSDGLAWAADNVALWQPWALLLAVGVLILSVVILVEVWHG
jgi:uncharacterized membrane protein YbhN (UPF0104 family)